MFDPTHVRIVVSLAALALLLAACTGDAVDEPRLDADGTTGDADAESDADVDADDPDAPHDVDDDLSDAAGDTQPPWWEDVPSLPACEPALALDPPSATTATRGLVTFRATGGTGEYTFSLAERPSGGSIEPGLGTYRAGDIDGVVDVVRVTDAGCEGVARAEVSVESPFSLQPREVVTAPGTSFQFLVEGGTGQFDFALGAGAGSGATLTADGTYTAGPDDGLDLVIVTDVATGDVLDARVRVDAAATFELVPPTVALPVGHRVRPRATAGSGHFDAVVSPASVATMSGLDLEATAAGTATVELIDRFTGDSATLQLVVSEALPWTPLRYGDVEQWASIVTGVGDLDGDGFDDAIVGVPEADITGYQSGVVLVFRGTGAGLDPEPVRVIADAGRLADFGQDIVVVDVDGDGRRDLVVGAPDADVDLGDAGGVYVYPGVEGEFFAAEPARILGGPFRGDRFGYSLAACDFNADGFQDLAVGARFAEDRRISPLVSNQGAVHVYLGGAGGLQPAPTDSLYGMVPDANGTLVNTRDLNLGGALAAADFDGDGLCDLAVGALAFEAQPNRSNDGAVFIYRGRADTETRFGGVERQPARIIGGVRDDDAGGQLGRHLAAGDLDGDGRAELAISHGNADAGGTRRGAAFVLPGVDLAGPATEVEDLASFTWVQAGDDNYDQHGWSVDLADVTGDGLLDVIIGSSADELPDQPSTTGVVRVYAGRSGALPALEPTFEVAGPDSDDQARLGGRVGAPGDLDGDGTVDIVSFASFDGTFGFRVGRFYQIAGADHALTGLDMPGHPSGSRAGASVAVVAGQGGRHYLAVGAPLAGHEDQTRAGVVEIHEVAGGAIGSAATQRLGGFPGHSSSDELGYAVANGGDFDGDGLDDLLVVARTDESPGSFDPATWTVLGGCGASPSNAGAVYVFLGTGSGFETTPSFVHYASTNQNIHTVAGDVDVNGDGLDDLVYGGQSWDGPGGSNSGGFAVVLGRAVPAATAGTTHVICAPELEYDGPDASDEMGFALTGVGDVDGDGCEEIAVGVRRYDLSGANDAGLVDVHFGWDSTATHCAANRRRVALTTAAPDAEQGFALAGGLDVTGDGVPDLVVGAPDYRVSGDTTGRIVLVDGARLGALPKTAAGAGNSDPATTHPLVDVSVAGKTFYLDGDETGEDFGASVALVPGAGPGGRAAIATGRPLVSLGQPGAGGAVSVYVFRNAGGLDADPVAVIAGESEAFEPGFGASVAAVRHDGQSLVIVGSPLSSAVSIDEGAAFGFLLP